jgi:lipoprotein signal peptidase
MQTTRGTSLTEEVLAAPRKHRRSGVLVATAVLVLAADVISKVLVVDKLANRPPVRLLDGFLTLDYTRNPGAAFSIGTGATLIFAIVAIAVIAVILRTSRRLFSRPWAVVLGLLLGGATGNLIDRLVRSPGVMRGYVVDWIQLPHFAVFNLADSAITVGGALAVLLALTGHQMDGSVIRPNRGAHAAPVRWSQRKQADPPESSPDEPTS